MLGIDFGAKRGTGGTALAAVPLVAALTFGALMLPRAAVPEVVPTPVVDESALGAVVREDTARAARARTDGLDSAVRELGSLLRDFNKAEAQGDDAARLGSARSAIDQALAPLVGKDPEKLRVLRAVQLEAFLDEVRAFERGAPSDEPSAELVALAGAFVTRMRAVGWARGRRILLDESERRVAYKLAWNGIAGVDRRPELALTLDETRVLYGLYFRLPHAPEAQIRAFEAARRGARDAAACDALTAGEHLAAESFRLERIQRFAAIDPTYPAAYAKGIAQFRLRKFLAASDSFETELRDHEGGPYSAKAKNFLRASLAAAREESL